VFDGRSCQIPGGRSGLAADWQGPAVIDYLNQQENVHQFLASGCPFVDATVSSYEERKFKNLMCSFGCTGGQHRSVFLAEQLAKRLRAEKGLHVEVRHLGLEALGQ